MLRQLGNVFIVQPDILKTYLNEAYLARIENRLLRPYVAMRSDYGNYSTRFWEDVFGGDVVAPAQAKEGATTAGAVGAMSAGLIGLPGLGLAGKFPSLSSFTHSSSSASSPTSHPQHSTSTGPLSSSTSSLPPPSSHSGAHQTPLHSADPIAALQAQAAQGNGRKQSLFGNLMRDFEGLGLSEGEGENKRGSVHGR
jgi:hypothetical protein